MTPARCPRCAGPLEEAIDNRVKASRCDACGGTWLALDSYRRVRGAGSALVGAATLDAAPPAAPAATATPCRCPVCGAGMRRERLVPGGVEPASGIDIDVCDPHGAWFDPSELRALARARGVAWDSAGDTASGFMQAIGGLLDLVRGPFS